MHASQMTRRFLPAQTASCLSSWPPYACPCQLTATRGPVGPSPGRLTPQPETRRPSTLAWGGAPIAVPAASLTRNTATPRPPRVAALTCMAAPACAAAETPARTMTDKPRALTACMDARTASGQVSREPASRQAAATRRCVCGSRLCDLDGAGFPFLRCSAGRCVVGGILGNRLLKGECVQVPSLRLASPPPRLPRAAPRRRSGRQPAKRPRPRPRRSLHRRTLSLHQNLRRLQRALRRSLLRRQRALRRSLRRLRGRERRRQGPVAARLQPRQVRRRRPRRQRRRRLRQSRYRRT